MQSHPQKGAMILFSHQENRFVDEKNAEEMGMTGKTRRKSIVHRVFILTALVMMVLPAAAAGLPPAITLLGRNPASLTVGSVGYFDAGAMAADPEDGDLTAIINVSSTVNVTRVGTYRVNYSVTDSGNNTVNASRIVRVVNRLDPATIPKYQTPLIIPPEMPKTSTSPAMDYYAIAVREFNQQILPAGMPKTRVWSYGSLHNARDLQLPGLHHRSNGRQTDQSQVDQRADRPERQLPAPPAADRPDPALGQPGRWYCGTGYERH